MSKPSRKRRSRARIGNGWVNLPDDIYQDIQTWCDVNRIKPFEQGAISLLDQILTIQKMFGFRFVPFAHTLDEVTNKSAQVVTGPVRVPTAGR
jgi:hypothetical protein